MTGLPSRPAWLVRSLRRGLLRKCHGNEIVRREWRLLVAQQRALPHVREHAQVEEVHRAEDEQYESDLGAEELDGLLQRVRLVAVFQRQRDVADVDEIEADDQQMV